MQLGKLTARIALVGLAAFMFQAAQAGTTGTIVGTIQDASNGNPVAGALVIAQSPALQGEQTALTSEEGTFRITLLPPGEYTVLVQADTYRPREQAGVRVDLDKTIRVTLQVVPDSLRAEDVVVTAAAPVIDQGSTTSGAVIPEDFHEYVPTGRDFSAVLNVAPGATNDGLGASFRGSSAPENSWIIDGVNTTEIANAARLNGSSSTALPNDFVEQVEIKTGGYNAEYGRATGGVVNVVTKSGGNEFHGDVFVNFSSAGLTAGSRTLETEASSIMADSQDLLDMDFGFDLGGYIVKDKLWFFVGVTPFLGNTRYTRTVNRVTGTEIDPETGEERDVFEAVPDLEREFNNKSVALTRLAKLTFNVNENHSVQLSYFGDPTSETGIQRTSLSGDPDSLQQEVEEGMHNLAARWTGKLFDKSMLVEAWYGMSLQQDKQTPEGDWAELDPGVIGPAEFVSGYTPQRAMVSRYALVPDEFAQVCPSCAVANYFQGPFWFQQDDQSSRHSANLKLTNFFGLAGEHALKYGGDIEFNSFVNSRGYKNHWAISDYGPQDVTGRDYRWRYQGLGRVDENGVFTPSEFLDSDSTTRNTSLFVQDSYQPIDNLSLNLGVRWETQAIYGHDADAPTVTINDNIAPRVGAIYDWTGVGRSKIEAYYGRFYEAIPLNINSRAFGQEGFGYQWIAEDGENITQREDWYEVPIAVFGGEDAYVVKNLKGQYVDEYSAGLEYEILPDLAVGASFVHREIGRVIEDVSPDNGLTYIIANVGDDNQVDGALDELAAEIAGLGGDLGDLGAEFDSDVVCGAVTDADDFAACEQLVADADLTRAVKQFPAPRRTYDGLELTVRKNFSNRWYMVGSLTLSRTLGNYPGLFAPENGQLDANITSQYDLPQLLVNRYGPLRNDRPVYFKLDGYYLWDFGLITGASFRAFSGRPIDALMADQDYGEDEGFLLPRGIGGRTPALYSLDLNLGYDVKISDDLKVNFNANIFNVFNTQQYGNVDHAYTDDVVRPVVGGSLSDIEDAEGNPTLLNSDGVAVTKNPDWRNPIALTQFQAPLQVRLGMRVSF